MKSISKLHLVLVLVSLLALPMSVHAATIDDVKSLVNSEYSSGNITSSDIRNNLRVLCDDIKTKNAAGDVPNRDAMVETFRLVIQTHREITIINGAADRIKAELNAVIW